MTKSLNAAALLFTLLFTSLSSAITTGGETTLGELPKLSSTPLMQNEARLIVEMLETMHFESAEISNESFSDLLTQYMEALDFNKLYFLAENETNFIEKYGPTLGFELRYQGELDAAFDIYSLYRDRAMTRVDWALTQLEKEWTFDTDEFFIYDRSESDWPATEAEADELWRLRLKYELLQEILNDKTQDEAKERITKRYERVRRSLHEFGSKDVEEVFLTTLTKMFDPHSSFLSSDTLEDFNISMRLKLIGIGAMLSEEDGYCVIRELVPGAPAMRSKKLEPNDRIVAVAQEGEEPVDIIGMGLRKVVDQIRGEKGSKVTLTIIPGDATDNSIREEVVIVRDEVHINSSRTTGKIFEVPDENGNLSPIGVIDIPTFYGGDEYIENGQRYTTSVTDDVEELVIKMKEAGAQGIVLDLRRNGGGLLDEAIKMTGLFIRRGPVVQVREKSGYVISHMDRDPKVAYSGPLAVLTSRYSASASEILAGALQNYGRALTIGNTSTHGKGTVQQVFSLDQYILRRDLGDDRAGAAKLTIRKFYLPNGSSTQRKGVVPDIQLKSIEEVVAVGEADLPQSLSWDYIKPVARFVEMTLKNSLLEALLAGSEARAEQLEEFRFLQKRLDWFAEREERKQISLNLEHRKVMMEADEAFLDSLKDEQRLLAANNFANSEVKLDSVIREEAQRDREAEELGKEQVTESAEPQVIETEEEKDSSLASASDSDPDGKEDEEEEVPDFDIQLRETLRIMTEAIKIAPNPADWAQPALPIASNSRFESLIH